MNKIDKKQVLALDIATKTGWALSAQVYGTWDFKVKRDESGGMRLVRFRAKLREVCELEDIKLIVFERAAGKHANAVMVESELISTFKVFCEDAGIEYRAYSAGEIKRFATGKGRASKSDMVIAAKDKYGYPGFSDDEADALHLLHLAIEDLCL